MLEYLPGGSLKERLTGPISPRVAASLLLPIAEALEKLHSAGIWHLDLKPANILIDARAGDASRSRVAQALRFWNRPLHVATMTPRGPAAVRCRAPCCTWLPSRSRADVRRWDRPPTSTRWVSSFTSWSPAGRLYWLIPMARRCGRSRPKTRSRRVDSISKVPRDFEVLCLKCLEKDPRRASRPRGPLRTTWDDGSKAARSRRDGSPSPRGDGGCVAAAPWSPLWWPPWR